MITVVGIPYEKLQEFTAICEINSLLMYTEQHAQRVLQELGPSVHQAACIGKN